MTSMQEYRRDRFWDPHLFLAYINDFPDGALSRIGIYADDTTAYSSMQTTDLIDRMEMTAEPDEDLPCIIQCY